MIKPFSFDIETAKKCLPDWHVRDIENHARKTADEGEPQLMFQHEYFKIKMDTYYEQVLKQHRYNIWIDTYNRRIERLKRINN